MFYDDDNEYDKKDREISSILSKDPLDIEKLSLFLKDKPFKDRESGSWQAYIYNPLVLKYTNTNPSKEELKKYHEAFRLLTQNGGNIFLSVNYNTPLYKNIIKKNDIVLFKNLLSLYSKDDFPSYDLYMHILNEGKNQKHKKFEFIKALYDAGYDASYNLNHEKSLAVATIAYNMFLPLSKAFHKDTLPVLKFFQDKLSAIVPPHNITNIYSLYKSYKIVPNENDEVLSWCIKNCSDQDKFFDLVSNDKKFEPLKVIAHKVLLKDGIKPNKAPKAKTRKL